MKLIFLKIVLPGLLILGGFVSTSAQSIVDKSETPDYTEQIQNEKYQKEKLITLNNEYKMTAEYAVDEKKFTEILKSTPEEMTDESLKAFQENISQWTDESPNYFLVLDEKERTLFNNGDFKRLYVYSIQKRNTSKK
jgi:hypothetical protein